MNLIHGKVVEVYQQDGRWCGKVRVDGACKTVPLDLLAEADNGDVVLPCDGVAIGKVRDAVEPFETDVPRDTRKAD